MIHKGLNAAALIHNGFFLFFGTATYGGLTNNGVDDSDNGLVVVDKTDVVAAYGGSYISRYVQQISLDFAMAPSTATPEIWLYVMNMTVSPNRFDAVVTYQLPYTSIITGSTGPQTMVLPVNAMPISTNQYMAVGFGPGGGSPYQVTGRTEYYHTPANFASVGNTTYTSFANGFAFSFTVATVVPVAG